MINITTITNRTIVDRIQTEYGLSFSTIAWLYKWSQFAVGTVDDKTKNELSRFKPTSAVMLYRGVVVRKTESVSSSVEKMYTSLTSWSHDKEIASFHAERFTQGNTGIILSALIQPSQILVDFTMLPEELQTEEKEVVILPTKLKVSTVITK